MDEDSQASQQAKQMGLTYKGFGRWADPQTGKVTHKSDNGRLVAVDQQAQTQEPSGQQAPDGGQAGQAPDGTGEVPSDTKNDPERAASGGKYPAGFGSEEGKRTGKPMPADWDNYVNKFGSNTEMMYVSLQGGNPKNPQDAIRQFNKMSKDRDTLRDYLQFRADVWDWAKENEVGTDDLVKQGFKQTGDGAYSAKYEGPNGVVFNIRQNNASVQTPDGETKSFKSIDYGSDIGAHNAARLYALNKSAESSTGSSDGGNVMNRGDNESEDDFYNRMAGQSASQDRGERGLDMDPPGDGPSAPEPNDELTQRYREIQQKMQKIQDTVLDNRDAGPALVDRAAKLISQLRLEKNKIANQIKTNEPTAVDPNDNQAQFKAADDRGELPADGPPGPDTMGDKPPRRSRPKGKGSSMPISQYDKESPAALAAEWGNLKNRIKKAKESGDKIAYGEAMSKARTLKQILDYRGLASN